MNVVRAASPETASPLRKSSRLTSSELWALDARRVVGIPGGFLQRRVDMTHGVEALRRMHEQGLAASFAHLVLRAAGLALARNPELYRMVCGYDRLAPASIDIGLTTSDAPSDLPAIVARVEQTPLGALVARANEALSVADRSTRRVARGGWLAAFGLVRRWLLRGLRRAFRTRRLLGGFFEVAYDANADVVGSLRFHSDAILAAGRVRDVVVLVDGAVAIRPVSVLTVTTDHVAMDAMRATALLNAVKEILESDELVVEAGAHATAEPARGR